MEKGLSKSLHDVTSVVVKMKHPEVAKDRDKSVVDGIDERIKKLNNSRKERAYPFIEKLNK